MIKALFQSNEIEEPITPSIKEARVIAVATPNVQTQICKVNQSVADCFPRIEQGFDYHFSTAGMWSSHDLLFHILSLIGSAHVTIATWSITEAPAAMLMRGLYENPITSLNALFDVRVRVRSPSSFEFIKHNLGEFCRITSCHAKVTVIENDDWKISINGSANYTNNPRIEAGVVSTSPQVASFHKDWIIAEINKSQPFK